MPFPLFSRAQRSAASAVLASPAIARSAVILVMISVFFADKASAQYFGPFGFGPPAFSPRAFSPRAGFGFQPRRVVRVGPAVAVGAIPHWSRYPVYGIPAVVPVQPVDVIVPVPAVVPVAVIPPVSPYASALSSYRGYDRGYGYGLSINLGGLGYHADFHFEDPYRRTPIQPTQLGRQVTPVYPAPFEDTRSESQYDGSGRLDHSGRSIMRSGSLTDGPSRLAQALASHPEGEVWLEYLQPDRIAMNGDMDSLKQLAERYQGVIANPDLAWISSLDGFRETNVLLNGDTLVDEISDGQESVLLNQRTITSDRPASGQPTLAPQLPSDDRKDDAGKTDDGEQSVDRVEELPAPTAQPTTSV